MKLPLQITFRNLAPKPEIEQAIEEKVEKLITRHQEIIGCRVVVEVPHRHHQHGNYYSFKIDISVPEKEIVVSHDAGDRADDYRNYRVALTDAFNAAARQLDHGAGH